MPPVRSQPRRSVFQDLPNGQNIHELGNTLRPNPYANRAREDLAKYKQLQKLGTGFIVTVEAACDKYVHNGCLCFIRKEL